MSILREFFFGKSKPREKKVARPLEAIQIGISPICNLKCTFCPTTFIPEENAKLMTLEDFSLLKPYFSWANWIYLQGWGEPLLNKDFWEMAAMAKDSDTKVGFTTNGMLLDEEVAQQIIRDKIDLVSISVAGDASEIHNSLRVGSEFTAIIDNIKYLINLREKLGSDTPKVSLSYMLTKDSIKHLPDTIKLADEIGADDLYAINIDCVFSHEADENKVFNWGEKPHKDHEKIVMNSILLASDLGLSFRHYLLDMKEQAPVCELDPNKFVFVTADGDVTPCTALGRKVNSRIYEGKQIELPRKTFGNIKDNTFEEIWNKTDYQEFRKNFITRLEEYNILIATFADNEPTPIRLKETQERYENALKNNPLPAECQSCPKAYGL